MLAHIEQFYLRLKFRPVTAPPKGSREVVTAILKRPTMEEKAGFCVEEVFNMEEELALCFFDVVRPVQDLSDLCEW